MRRWIDETEIQTLKAVLDAARVAARAPDDMEAIESLRLAVEYADARHGLVLARDGQRANPRVNLRGELVHAGQCRACGGHGRVNVSPSHPHDPAGISSMAVCGECDDEGAVEDPSCDCDLCMTVYERMEAVRAVRQ